MADPTVTIIITEGEKKAACACKHGLPTIGLGGVFLHLDAKLNFHQLFEAAIGENFSVAAIDERQRAAMDLVGLTSHGWHKA